MNCKYCGRECKNKNSLTQHEIRCKENPNRIDTSYVSNIWKEYNSDIRSGKRTKTYTNQYTKAELMNLDKPIVSESTRLKLSNIWKGKKHSEESKQKISKSIKNAIINNPESYSSSNINGRIKKKEYNGNVFDSSWEVKVVKVLDEHNVKWIKPINGIPYEWNNSIHLYFPDFYIPSVDMYIEVKGYKRDRDNYKWEVVKNLVVVDKDSISDIESHFDMYMPDWRNG